ncbi:hypothetical protein EBZ37_07825 [bacterium]|nr:hypothetical protein [bacterium]
MLNFSDWSKFEANFSQPVLADPSIDPAAAICIFKEQALSVAQKFDPHAVWLPISTESFGEA